MTVYLDASVLVAIFVDDPLTERARVVLRTHSPVLIVSDFAATEFASAVARLVRIGDVPARGARETFATFDLWISKEAVRTETTTSDIASAAAFIRRLDLTLRAPDAIHVAAAKRIGADLFTFDKQLTIAARALGARLFPA